MFCLSSINFAVLSTVTLFSYRLLYLTQLFKKLFSCIEFPTSPSLPTQRRPFSPCISRSPRQVPACPLPDTLFLRFLALFILLRPLLLSPLHRLLISYPVVWLYGRLSSFCIPWILPKCSPLHSELAHSLSPGSTSSNPHSHVCIEPVLPQITEALQTLQERNLDH